MVIRLIYVMVKNDKISVIKSSIPVFTCPSERLSLLSTKKRFATVVLSVNALTPEVLKVFKSPAPVDVSNNTHNPAKTRNKDAWF